MPPIAKTPPGGGGVFGLQSLCRLGTRPTELTPATQCSQAIARRRVVLRTTFNDDGYFPGLETAR